MLGSAGLGNSLLQIVVLHGLHGQLVVPLLQGQDLPLVRNQAGDHIVDDDGPQVDKKQEQCVLRPQCDLKARAGDVAVEGIVPHHIERGRDQPEIIPFKARRLFFHRRGVHLFHVQNDGAGEEQLHGQEHQGKGPAVALKGQLGEELPLGALGGDDGEIGDVGEHQEGEQGLSEMLFHRQEVKRRVEDRADGADDAHLVPVGKGGPCSQQQLQNGQQADQCPCDPPGKAQAAPEGIQGQPQKRQEIQQRVNGHLGHAVQRRHQTSPPLRRR